MPLMPHPKTYIHPSSESALTPHLRQFLPNALPVYRRLSHPFKNNDSFALATFPPPDPANGDAPADALPQCFAIAFVNRSYRPATEMWLFLSGEIEGRCSCAQALGVKATGDIVGVNEENESKRYDARASLTSPCVAALLSLMKYVATSVPWHPHTPERLEDIERAAKLVEQLKASAKTDAAAMKSHYPEHTFFLRNVHDPTRLKLGAVAALPAVILHLHGLLVAPPVHDLAHHLYIFRVPDGLPRGRELGKGLEWRRVTEEDFDLVRIRSPIPRTHRTLRLWNSIGVYETTEGEEGAGTGEASAAVAWAFLGYDGSLSSMHVEPKYRGRGIAKTLSTKLFCEYPEPDGWALAYVGVANRESEAVCEGIGGVAKSWCWWLTLNMDAVNQLDA